MIIFIDDHSKYVWVDFMKENLKARIKFKEFKEKVDKEVGKEVRCLCIDNRGECHHISLQSICKSVRYVNNLSFQLHCSKMELLRERTNI